MSIVQDFRQSIAGELPIEQTYNLQKIIDSENRLNTETDDKNPFMLLPIRLEARFIEASRHIYEPALSPTGSNINASISQTIKYINDLIVKDNYTDLTILSAIDDTTSLMLEINLAVDGFTPENELENNIIVTVNSILSNAIDDFNIMANAVVLQDSANETLRLQKVTLLTDERDNLTNTIVSMGYVTNDNFTLISNEVSSILNDISTNVSNADAITFSQLGDLENEENNINLVITNTTSITRDLVSLGFVTIYEKSLLKASIELYETTLYNLNDRITNAPVQQGGADELLQGQLTHSLTTIKRLSGLMGAMVITSQSVVGFANSFRMNLVLNDLDISFNNLLSGSNFEVPENIQQREALALDLWDKAVKVKQLVTNCYISSEEAAEVTAALGNIENHITNYKLAAEPQEGEPEAYVLNEQTVTTIQLRKLVEHVHNSMQSKIGEAIIDDEEAYLLEAVSRKGSIGGLSNSDGWEVDPDRDFDLASQDEVSYVEYLGDYIIVHELWVRIYPDDIFVHSHEEGLTQEEIDDAKIFWREWWNAKGDKDLQLGAWRALVAAYGVERSAYLVRCLEPVNLDNYIDSEFRSIFDDVKAVSSFVGALSNVNLEAVSRPESFFAVLGEKMATLNRFAVDKTTPGEYQMFKMNTALNEVNQQLKKLEDNVKQTGNDDFNKMQFHVVKQFEDLKGTLDKVGAKTGDSEEKQAAIHGEPNFPSIPANKIKGGVWTEAARTYVLPDYFTAFAINDIDESLGGGTNVDYPHDFRYIKAGNDIPQNRTDFNGFQLGLNPDPASGFEFRHDTLGNLVVDPGLKWMVDYNKAVADGMAITINLEETDYNNGFDKLMVLGTRTQNLKGTTLPDKNLIKDGSKELIEQMFKNHMYANDEGMSILRMGIPTNNTDKENAGFNNEPITEENSFKYYADEPVYDVVNDSAEHLFSINKTDGQWLAESLGLSPDFFEHIPNADLKQVSGAISMNRALWGGTFGYYLEDMFDTAITVDAVERARSFFTNYVIPRGIVPTIRVGDQPYGILPTTAFQRLNAPSPDEVKDYTIDPAFKDAVENEYYDYLTYLLHSHEGAHLQDPSNRQIVYLDPPPNQSSQYPPLDAERLNKYTQRHFDQNKLQLIKKLYKEWLTKANESVEYITNPNNDDPQATFIKIFGLHATAEEYYQRYSINLAPGSMYAHELGFPPYFNKLRDEGRLINAAERLDQLRIDANTVLGFDTFNNLYGSQGLINVPFGQQTQGGWPKFYNNPATLGSARIFEMRFLQHQVQLNGPEVTKAAKKLSEEKELSEYAGADYINWLLTQPKLRNIFDVFRRPAPVTEYDSSGVIIPPDPFVEPLHFRSLLFMLLRQSYLYTHRSSTMDYLMKRFILTPQDRLALGAQEDIMTSRFHPDFPIAYRPAQFQVPVNKWSITVNPFIDVVQDPMFFQYCYTLQGPTDEGFRYIHNYLDSLALDAYPPDANDYNPSEVYSTDNHVIGTSSGDIKYACFDDAISLELGKYRGAIGDALREFNTSDLSLPTNLPIINPDDRVSLDQMEEALKMLSNESTSALQRLMTEHLDVCSYRLDGWMTGLINKKLFTARKGWLDTVTPSTTTVNSANDGNYLGAYGWLLDVRKGGERILVDQADVPTSLRDSGKTFFDQDNLGYIHAPSMDHALTAAILRSGYVSENDESDLNNKFAVNLSSERVRLATSLMEGVRNGQDVSAMLGYMFERYLHEQGQQNNALELDIYIHQLRETFPLVPEVSVATAVSQPDITVNRVVNGVEMLNAVRTEMEAQINGARDKSLYQVLIDNSADYPFGLGTGMPGSGTSKTEAIIKGLDHIANAIDALGDLAIAEGVFQVSKGNYERGSAVLDALAKGKNPPETEIAETPRSGKIVTNRVFLQVPLNGALTTGYSAMDPTPRSIAEPAINQWLGSALPDPTAIKCLVSYEDLGGSTVDLTVTVADLRLQPMDLFYILDQTIEEPGTELERRIAYWVRSTQNIDATISLDIRFTERDPSWVTTDYTIFEVMPQIDALTEVVRNGRPATAIDYTDNEEDTDPNNQKGYDTSELMLRLTSIKDDLQIQLSNLDAATFTALTPADKRSYLMGVSAYTGANAIPATFTETDIESIEALDSQAKEAYDLVLQKSDAISVLGTNTNNDPDKTVAELTLAFNIIFGETFNVFPQFSFYNQSSYIDQLTPSRQDILVPPGNDLVMDQWLYGVARVRKNVESLESLRLVAEKTTFKEAPLTPLQFPVSPDDSGRDYWLGAEYPDNDYQPSGNRLSLVVIDAPLLSGLSNKHVGIYLDAWVEKIPEKEESTGLSFHYDQPNAKPPQSILLAVSPYVVQETERGWELDNLVYSMLDTLNMSKVRCVEPEHLQDGIFGHLLPAVMGEVPTPLTEVYFDTDGNTTQGNEAFNNSLSNNTGTFDFNANNMDPPSNISTGPIGTMPPSHSGHLSHKDDNDFANIDMTRVRENIGKLKELKDKIVNEGISINENTALGNMQNSVSLKIDFDNN